MRTGESVPRALFVAAHPDDETLAMGVAIVHHVEAGTDVHVLLLTRGTTSSALGSLNGGRRSVWWGMRHDPSAEGYEPLTIEEFGQARVTESQNALRCLGSGLGFVTMHEAHLTSDALTVQAVADAILATVDRIAPSNSVQIRTHSPIADDHADHIVAGQAVQQVANSDPARFKDPRYFVLSSYWADPRLSGLDLCRELAHDDDVEARIKNACRSYGAWAPPFSYAIGYHSTWYLFEHLIAEQQCVHHR